jgi:ubiquinone/menaquinone biosynthesis C-methylase UbiE
MNREQEIRDSYRQLGGSYGSLYDAVVTYSTPAGKLLNKLMWGFDDKTTARWMREAMGGIPDGFSGRLLEVPVGTGVLTMPLYRRLPNAQVTCVDYSAEMMRNAEGRARAMGIGNVAFMQGDVGRLPFEDESFDVVLSLNGFHAFPDKDAAFRETHRVLRKGGTFCGCFYIQGQMRRTDWFCKHLLTPKVSFTPPYETKRSLEERLDGIYRVVEVTSVNAEGVFRCVK